MTDVVVEPRIAQRRLEVGEQSRRARRRPVLLVLAGLTVVVAAAAISRSPLLDVERIEVFGLNRVSLREALDVLDVEVSSPLVSVDVDRATAALTAIPWVDQARVERSWNGTVTIEISERTPVAVALTAPDQWVLVDGDGRVLSEPLPVVPRLPRLSGLRAAGVPGSFMADDSAAPLAVAQALPAELVERVYGIWRDERGELRIGLIGGPTVLLGDDDRLRAKVAATATMLEQLAFETGPHDELAQVLDVSVPNLPVVRLR